MPSVHRVVSYISEQLVVAPAAGQPIITQVAQHKVITMLAEHSVLAAHPQGPIVSECQTDDDVVAAQPD